MAFTAFQTLEAPPNMRNLLLLLDNSFKYQFSSWTEKVRADAAADWTTQLRILNEIVDLVTPQLSLEEIIRVIYQNINQLLDAYQFGIGLYNEDEQMIHYQGMIEEGKQIPDFSFSALDETRLASWCVRNNSDIFMNDFDEDYINYLPRKPQPLAGINPQAALYTPLKLNEKVVGLVVVRTKYKNVYQPHHLYLLKTVGGFVVRALELSRLKATPFVQGIGRSKEWRWNEMDQLPRASRNALLLLTERERQVLLLLVAGMANKTIAQQLFVSADTVKTHTLHIYQKMQVANRGSAIMKAVEQRWII